MLYSFPKLLSYAWQNLLSHLGTTTLSVALFSFVIPMVIFFVKLLYSSASKQKANLKMGRIIKDSLWSWQTIIPSLIYLLAWIGLIAWGASNFIYEDHKHLLARITALHQDSIASSNNSQASLKPIQHKSQPRNPWSVNWIQFSAELMKHRSFSSKIVTDGSQKAHEFAALLNNCLVLAGWQNNFDIDLPFDRSNFPCRLTIAVSNVQANPNDSSAEVAQELVRLLKQMGNSAGLEKLNENYPKNFMRFKVSAR